MLYYWKPYSTDNQLPNFLTLGHAGDQTKVQSGRGRVCYHLCLDAPLLRLKLERCSILTWHSCGRISDWLRSSPKLWIHHMLSHPLPKEELFSAVPFYPFAKKFGVKYIFKKCVYYSVHHCMLFESYFPTTSHGRWYCLCAEEYLIINIPLNRAICSKLGAYWQEHIFTSGQEVLFSRLFIWLSVFFVTLKFFEDFEVWWSVSLFYACSSAPF